MALSSQHVQPTAGPDLGPHFGTLRFEALHQGVHPLLALRRRRVQAVGPNLALGQILWIAAQDNVHSPSGHVGGHGDRPRAAGLGHHFGLAEVLLGVEDLVIHAVLFQLTGKPLRVLDRDRTDQHRLADVAALHDVGHHGVELPCLRLEDQVALVEADHRAVGGDGDHLEAVDPGQLSSLGLSRSGHPGQFLVEAEVVLEGDGGQGLVLLLDRHSLLGLDGLVDAVRPPAPFQHPAGELIDDPDLAVDHDVVLIPLVQLLGLQRGVELVDQIGGDLVVQVVHAQGGLDGVDSVLGRGNDSLLLVYLVVMFALEAPDHGSEPLVESSRLTQPAADNQRGSGLIDEDRVHLVHDAERVASLRSFLIGHSHVVPEVVETELIVGSVGDVGGVSSSLLVPVPNLGDHQAHRESEPPVDLAHPLGISAGQVVVDRAEVDTPPRQAVEVGRQGRDEGLALAGAHLSHPSQVKGHAPHHLNVVVPLPDNPPSGLPDHTERLDEEVVDFLASVEALPELPRHGP